MMARHIYAWRITSQAIQVTYHPFGEDPADSKVLHPEVFQTIFGFVPEAGEVWAVSMTGCRDLTAEQLSRPKAPLPKFNISRRVYGRPDHSQKDEGVTADAGIFTDPTKQYGVPRLKGPLEILRSFDELKKAIVGQAVWLSEAAGGFHNATTLPKEAWIEIDLIQLEVGKTGEQTIGSCKPGVQGSDLTHLSDLTPEGRKAVEAPDELTEFEKAWRALVASLGQEMATKALESMGVTSLQWENGGGLKGPIKNVLRPPAKFHPQATYCDGPHDGTEECPNCVDVNSKHISPTKDEHDLRMRGVDPSVTTRTASVSPKEGWDGVPVVHEEGKEAADKVLGEAVDSILGAIGVPKMVFQADEAGARISPSSEESASKTFNSPRCPKCRSKAIFSPQGKDQTEMKCGRCSHTFHSADAVR